MKTIYLLRHAKAENRTADIPDKERKLVKTGIEDSKKIAKAFRAEKEIPDLIVSSDAPRALETAEIFAKKLKIDTDGIVLNQKLYAVSTAPPVMNIIKGLEEKYKSVMLVGHDPLLSTVANYFVKEFTYDLPKTSVLKIECAARKWGDVTPGKNKVTLFLAPASKKKADKIKRQLTVNLEHNLETLIFNTVKRFDPHSADKSAKIIRKRSRQIVDDIFKKQKHLPMKSIEDIGLFLSTEKTEEKVEKNN